MPLHLAGSDGFATEYQFWHLGLLKLFTPKFTWRWVRNHFAMLVGLKLRELEAVRDYVIDGDSSLHGDVASTR